MFNWIAKNAIPSLHGKKTCQRIEVNLFDEDVNEFLPFENASDTYSKAVTRLCWFHRHSLKVSALKKYDDPNSKEVLEGFNILANSISDYVENEVECQLVLALMFVWVTKALEEGKITDQFAEELSKQYLAYQIMINSTRK